MSFHLSLADLESNDPKARRGGREHRFLCPLCGDGKPRDTAHRSLAVNTSSGAWLCHRCGECGLLKEHWTNAAPQSRQERTRAAVLQAFALPKRAEISQPDEATESRWRGWWNVAHPLINSGETTIGAAYLAGRGIEADVASAAGVRFSTEFYGRLAVLCPVHDQAGALVAINGRFVDGDANRKTQTAGKTSSGVFATPGALSSPVVAVCEAPLDALSLWLCGIPAVALIGTSAPEWLASALAFRSVLLATDADAAGDETAEKLRATLEARGARTFRLRPRGGKDWNELLEKRGAEALKSFLAVFSMSSSDGLRACKAMELASAGRADAAHFITGLIGEVFMREQVRSHLRRPSGMVAGVLPDEIVIPADVPIDEENSRRCVDAQRLPVAAFAGAA